MTSQTPKFPQLLPVRRGAITSRQVLETKISAVNTIRYCEFIMRKIKLKHKRAGAAAQSIRTRSRLGSAWFTLGPDVTALRNCVLPRPRSQIRCRNRHKPKSD
jgi:hypothetical protein